MELDDAFKQAEKNTKFVRVRKNLLYTFGSTRLPYICISQLTGDGDYVMIRTGEILADKPQIALPGEMFAFEGFEDFWDEFADGEPVVSLARRISMPPSKYINKTEGVPERESGPMAKVVDKVMNRLENDNDVRTGVITAPEEVWGLSVLLYVGSQVARSAQSNVQEHFEHMRYRG